MTLMVVTVESVNNCNVRTGGDLRKILMLSPWNLKLHLFTIYVFIAQVYLCRPYVHYPKIKCSNTWVFDARIEVKNSPYTENSGQSHMTAHFENLHSCNSPAAGRAPAAGQRRGSSWLHHRRCWQPWYLDAGCSPAPQTVPGRGCGWGEDAAASRCSSARGKQKKKNYICEKSFLKKKKRWKRKR